MLSPGRAAVLAAARASGMPDLSPFANCRGGELFAMGRDDDDDDNGACVFDDRRRTQSGNNANNDAAASPLSCVHDSV